MTTHQEKTLPSLVDETNVIAFLRRHPEFFEGHAELLEDLKISHSAGRAVSLIERQVSVLREKNHQLRKQLGELIAVARENDKLNVTLHKLTLGLLTARTLSEVVYLLQRHLHEQFPKEFSSLILFSPPVAPEHIDLGATREIQVLSADDPSLAQFAVLFENAKPICGRMKTSQLQLLFGASADSVASAAFIPLRHENMDGVRNIGIIAVGSSDAQRFHASMGTVFITHMGQIISAALQKFVD